MNTALSFLEKAVSEAALDQLPEILGELERLKMLAWQRVMEPHVGRGMRDDKRDSLLTIPQTASRLNIPESRAYELARRQDGLPVIRIGKYLRVDPVALEGWLVEQVKMRLDTKVSSTYSQSHERGRAESNPKAARIDARAISRATGRPLEFDRAPGTGGDRHSRVTVSARAAAAGEE